MNQLWIPPTSNGDRSRRVSRVPREGFDETNQSFQRPAPLGPVPAHASSSHSLSSLSPTSPPVKKEDGEAHHRSPFLKKVSDEDHPLINTPFSRPIPIQPNGPIKIERFVPSPSLTAKALGSLAPSDNALAGPSSTSFTMPPPRPSETALGKRKAESEYPEDIPQRNRASSVFSFVKQEREPSSIPDIKPNIPIPILPLPLPSKRFKKRPTAKALLIPVEQLPVFALPPMPAIDNPDLLKQVFTHQSLFERPRGRFEDPKDDPIKHYEKLEHVGDSVLGMIVTTWLHETRPNLTIGTATKLKAHLVSNATLSHISGLYNLPQRLNGHPELLPVLRAQTDVRAALMEAYIAALYFSFPVENRLGEGIRVIDTWLREMYEPLYDFFYNYMKKEFEQHHLTIGSTFDGRSIHLENEDELRKIDEQAVGMGKLVECYCASQERELRWQEEKMYTNQGFLWKIKCLIDGIELSEAVRPFKRPARNVAGWEAAKKLGLTVSR
ncbi:hypothetical protein I302_103736 [Kwoniella bestiolae CBS 10118]|uniref:RNase III domain-containing protein n=1 Tax=Kwoniella bestiolae CBS 10118 TaxID=1296100 RepID=A0A1B9G9A7_9TREE|nr:hypothetical protein I302_02439 [Kwoniella bestiolae CBS 10118]OCF27596.1 hypothetical protein I302_02439 [Kwoniella bestiolae CBS 10118]